MARKAGIQALVVSACLLCISPAVTGQSAGINQGGPEYVHSQAGLNPIPQHGSSESASQMDQMRMAERQKRVAADTAKLVQLSNELKAQVDQAPKGQISLDMVRKSAEIEKLAHDLNGWLKY
jgi:hypothetical protein